jgi:hypothetical protein
VYSIAHSPSSQVALFWHVTSPDGTLMALRQLRDQAKPQLDEEYVELVGTSPRSTSARYRRARQGVLFPMDGSSISAVRIERTAYPVPLGGVSADQRLCVVRGGVEPPTFRFSGQPR